jgi:L-ribulokinase
LPWPDKCLFPIPDSPSVADILGRELKVTDSKQTRALGLAMFGAVAAGKAEGDYDTILEAAQRMARLKKATYRPNPTAQKVYDQLYAEYLTLHNYFGGGVNDVMKRLKHVKAKVRD